MKNFYVQWHLTDRCNMRCVGCYQDGYTGETELTLRELFLVCDNIFGTMKKWNTRLSVDITGGEPILKREFWEVFRYLNDSKYVSDIGIITNGTLIDRYVPKILTYRKLDNVSISLDGVSQDINDQIRGAGTYKKAIEAMRMLKMYNIPITIMFTLMKDNLEEARDLVDFAEELRVNRCIIERFVPLGQGKKVRDKVVSGQELNELYRHIFKSCGCTYNDQDIVRFRAIQVSFNEESIDLLGAECIVAKDGMAILPDGTALPCRRFVFPIGNLLEESLDVIWKTSDILNKLRTKSNMKGKCKDCRVMECLGCRAMVHSLTGDYLGEDPHCWLV